MSPLVGVFNFFVLLFSMYSSYIAFVRVIPGYLVPFGALIKDIVF